MTDVTSNNSFNEHQSRPYCSYCGSKNIHRDADAVWSESTNDWELCDQVPGEEYCGDCGGETILAWSSDGTAPITNNEQEG